MAIKVIAQRRVLKIGKTPGVKKFVMRPELYTPISTKKVFKDAATRSNISVAIMKAAWDAAGDAIKTWATEGHSVPIPGLGTMRFSVRSTAVEDLDDVKAGLITSRRIIFTPSVDLKDELKDTSILITCLDEDGNILKHVTSTDDGVVEEDNGNDNVNDNGNSLSPDPSPEGEEGNNGGNGSSDDDQN